MLPIILAAGIVFQTGFFRVVKSYRWFCGALIVNYAFTLLYLAFAYFGLFEYHKTPGNIGVDWSFYIALVFLPCPFPLIWTLRNVGWFDPSSRPDKWEPPAKSASEQAREGRAQRAAKRAKSDLKE